MDIDLVKWLNDNQGVVSVFTFLATILIAWAAGLFSALRHRPKLRLTLLQGPTFCVTFPTGKKSQGYDAHRTGIALYLRISNIGSSQTSIENVSLGYRWHLRPFSLLWLRHRVSWFWLQHPAVIMEDFRIKIGENFKYFPFLLQRSIISGASPDSYLRIGQSCHGVIYFEQPESWGGFFPSPKNGRTKVRVSVQDAFGNNHQRSFFIPIVALEEARKYNPSFGITFSNFDAGPVRSTRPESELVP